MHPIDLSDSASSYSRGDPGSRQCSCCPRRGRRHWGCCECTSACGRCEDPVSAGSEEAQRADVAGGEAEGGHADKAEEVRTVQYSVVVDQIRSDQCQTCRPIYLSIYPSIHPITRLLLLFPTLQTTGSHGEEGGRCRRRRRREAGRR